MNDLRVTPPELEPFLARLRAAAGPPSGPCLDDSQLVAYANDELPPPELERLDAHVVACSACCELLAELTEVAERAEHGAPATRRAALVGWIETWLEGAAIAPLVASVRGFLDQLSETLLSEHPAAPALASFSTSTTLQERSPDDLAGISVAARENGDLVVRIQARAHALEGVPVEVSAGDWRQRVRLRRVGLGDREEVGAEVIVPRHVRAALRGRTGLLVRVPSSDHAQP